MGGRCKQWLASLNQVDIDTVYFFKSSLEAMFENICIVPSSSFYNVGRWHCQVCFIYFFGGGNSGSSGIQSFFFFFLLDVSSSIDAAARDILPKASACGRDAESIFNSSCSYIVFNCNMKIQCL